MFSLIRYFSSLLLSIFIFFLTSSQLVLADNEYKDIVRISTFTEVCNWNIQCEAISTDQYVCHTQGEELIPNHGYIREISLGKELFGKNIAGTNTQKVSEIDPYKVSLYDSPNGESYPFVGIIKIQV